MFRSAETRSNNKVKKLVNTLKRERREAIANSRKTS